jgi:3',5'-cyclic-AMP phosphodiesterase
VSFERVLPVTKLIVFTDVHIVPAGQRIIGLDPVAKLAAGIAHVNQHHADADRVIITGDLTHFGDAESYQRLRVELAHLMPPLSLLIGNHDDRCAFAEAFPETPRDADGFVQSVLDVGAHRLVFLDSVKGKAHPDGPYHAGILCQRRLDWLEAQLSAAAGLRTWIFMHHPPHDSGFAGMDRIQLENGEAFYNVVRRHAQVEHLFCGHVHRTISGSHRGLPFSIFKSTCHQQPMTFDSLDTKIAIAEPAAYGIVIATPHGLQVHTEDFEVSAGLPIV